MVFGRLLNLVGGSNPFETYHISQDGNLPQLGVKNKKNLWNLEPPPRNLLRLISFTFFWGAIQQLFFGGEGMKWQP